jgi:hypothetical protein
LKTAFGKREWLVADCYWPEITGDGHYVSHESICVLNASDADAKIEITLYFEDREPMDAFTARCPARRTHHIRLDRLTNARGEAVPKGVPYALLLESDCPVVAQYTRLDTTQPNVALMTTIAY